MCKAGLISNDNKMKKEEKEEVCKAGLISDDKRMKKKEEKKKCARQI